VQRPVRHCSGSSPRVAGARTEGRLHMQDTLYVGLTLGFLVLSLGLVALCDRL
jgi:hypothetical protein